MQRAWCQGWGQEVEIPGGIRDGDLFDCPNWAGLTLRASERDGRWAVTAVKKASCAVGDEVVILPDDIQPGDVIECHGVRQRVTYDFGAYALVRLDQPPPWMRLPGAARGRGAWHRVDRRGIR